MTTVLPQPLAEAAFAAVKARYAGYFEPTLSEDGTREIAPGWNPPVLLNQDYHGAPGWTIMWEEGPEDWAYQVTQGGSTEEERVLLAAASAEFGATLTASEPKAVTFPAGVYAEPNTSYSVGLYPA